MNASARLFPSWERMENVGSEVALWQVPARPSAQRGPTYTLSLCGIWVQCVVTQALFFVEAQSLVSDAPTWNKRSSELLVVTRGAFASSGEESDKKASTRKIVECASSLYCRIFK